MPGKQARGSAVPVTPTLVQAAEAVLRGALEPALAMRNEGGERELVAQQV